MTAQPYYPPVAFYFQLSVEGEVIAFQEVSGISVETNVEEIVTGGENSFVHRVPTGATTSNLVLKRGIVPSGSRIINWLVNSIDQGLSTSIVTKDVTLSLCGVEGAVQKSWKFHNAYPVRYSVSDLKSVENTAVVESIEFGYTYYENGEGSESGNSV